MCNPMDDFFAYDFVTNDGDSFISSDEDEKTDDLFNDFDEESNDESDFGASDF